MFSVCSTAPMHGIARYASRCVWLFHMNVPTRSPAFDAQLGQRRGQLVGAVGDLGERRLGVPVAGERDDLAVGVDRAAVLEDRRIVNG